MENEQLIEARQFCSSHNLEITFLEELSEIGLIRITTINEEVYLYPEELSRAEKMARLHQELGINPAGLDAIDHLLNRVMQMKEEISQLRNRLNIYESE